MIVLFHKIGKALLQCCSQCIRSRMGFRRIRRCRKQFAKELNRGAEQVSAADSQPFAAGFLFQSNSGYSEFTFAAETFVGWGFGAGAKQNLETPAKFFDTSGEIHLVHVAFRIPGRTALTLL